MPEHPDPWPLRQLVLRTPRLELRPDDDDGLFEIVELIHGGIHPPEEMPFAQPFTDADPADIGPNAMRFFWEQRAACVGGTWMLNFLVRLDGRVIGTQTVRAMRFPITREISTGSWLGQPFQGHGYGTEMRAAVLMFAFDHLGATQARSSAFTTNPASQRVSAKLAYEPDGTELQVVREQRVTDLRLLLTRERFAQHRPDWTLDVSGIEGCLPFLATGQIPTNEP